MDEEPSAVFYDVEYLVGHSEFRDGLRGRLLLSNSWIGFTELDSEEPAGDGLDMASVESVEISEGEETSMSWGRAGATLLDNLFTGPSPSGGRPGQLPISNADECVNLAITTRVGQTACLRIHHDTMDKVRDALAPVLDAAGISLEEA